MAIYAAIVPAGLDEQFDRGHAAFGGALHDLEGEADPMTATVIDRARLGEIRNGGDVATVRQRRSEFDGFDDIHGGFLWKSRCGWSRRPSSAKALSASSSRHRGR